MSKAFFTADEHYGHENIIKHCSRPFDGVEEMDRELVRRHNEVVGKGDMVYHLGDFAFRNSKKKSIYINQLNGKHKFIIGSHDKGSGWLHNRLELVIKGQKVVMDHYPMRSWGWSFHGSWQLHGHSHGRVEPIGKQLDVGVDTHDFYPWEWDEIVEYMKDRPDNID